MTLLPLSEFVLTLDCPCCGADVAARADDDGYFYDGQLLLCGCKGHVSMDAEDLDPFVSVSECDVNHDKVSDGI